MQCSHGADSKGESSLRILLPGVDLRVDICSSLEAAAQQRGPQKCCVPHSHPVTSRRSTRLRSRKTAMSKVVFGPSTPVPRHSPPAHPRSPLPVSRKCPLQHGRGTSHHKSRPTNTRPFSPRLHRINSLTSSNLSVRLSAFGVCPISL